MLSGGSRCTRLTKFSSRNRALMGLLGKWQEKIGRSVDYSFTDGCEQRRGDLRGSLCKQGHAGSAAAGGGAGSAQEGKGAARKVSGGAGFSVPGRCGGGAVISSLPWLQHTGHGARRNALAVPLALREDLAVRADRRGDVQPGTQTAEVFVQRRIVIDPSAQVREKDIAGLLPCRKCCKGRAGRGHRSLGCASRLLSCRRRRQHAAAWHRRRHLGRASPRPR